MLDVPLALDYTAATGYSLLWIYAAAMLQTTGTKPLDLLQTVLLLVGLGALIVYHTKKIATKRDEFTSKGQKDTRLVAHSTLTYFFLLTLIPASMAVFQFYDIFGLTAHAFLTYAVATGASQLPGVLLLATYYTVITIHKAIQSKSKMLAQLIGSALLMVYFVLSGILSLKHMKW